MSNFGFAGLSELLVVAGPVLAAAEAADLATPGPYRPSEWTSPALTSITVPGTASGPPIPAQSDALGQTTAGAAGFPGTPAQILIFDAVFKIDHARELVRTEHPIQSSASSPVTSITDHAYQRPPQVTLEIGMSDAMATYANSWTGNASKSVSAYQALVTLQKNRTLVTLTTRLETYTQMLVESIRPSDTSKTLHGLKATVVLGQVFLADATAVSSKLITSADDTAQPQSARAQTTDATPNGTVQGAPPSAAVTAQHAITGGSAVVPGAGKWSSGFAATFKP